MGGAFGLPVDVDRSFERLVCGLITALSLWVAQPTTEGADRDHGRG
jgi:hypothetical protein